VTHLDDLGTDIIIDPTQKYLVCTGFFWLRIGTSYEDFVHNKKRNSVAWVRERIIPTEQTPHVGEVSANFCG
jgi:hypothetical protein